MATSAKEVKALSKLLLAELNWALRIGVTPPAPPPLPEIELPPAPLAGAAAEPPPVEPPTPAAVEPVAESVSIGPEPPTPEPPAIEAPADASLDPQVPPLQALKWLSRQLRQELSWGLRLGVVDAPPPPPVRLPPELLGAAAEGPAAEQAPPASSLRKRAANPDKPWEAYIEPSASPEPGPTPVKARAPETPAPVPSAPAPGPSGSPVKPAKTSAPLQPAPTNPRAEAQPDPRGPRSVPPSAAASAQASPQASASRAPQSEEALRQDQAPRSPRPEEAPRQGQAPRPEGAPRQGQAPRSPRPEEAPRQGQAPRPRWRWGTHQEPYPALMAALSQPPDLPGVGRVLGDCRRCPLAAGRTKIVFGAGNPQAELMFVGEGPGRDEDRQGQPFVGRAGEQLTAIIERGMGMRRDEVYITNVVKCRPPNNRDPEPGELERCVPFLRAQVVRVRPKVIVALGRHAAQVLLNTNSPLGRLRGRWGWFEGVAVMPTFHPAYLLRKPEAKREVWVDIKEVLRRLDRPIPRRGR